MKVLKSFRIMAVGALVCGLGTVAQAIPVQINGAISFQGGFSLNGSDFLGASMFSGFNHVTVLTGSTSGNYSGTDGTSVTFKPFTFSPPDTSVSPLWSFMVGGTSYTFDATSVSVPFKTATLLSIEGAGLAHIDGFTDTPGTWNITANQLGGATFSFSSSTFVVGKPVPDGGTTLIMLGGGLLVLALIRRTLKVA